MRRACFQGLFRVPLIAHAAVERSFQTDWSPSIAYMLRVCGDMAMAEECVQASFEAALKVWGDSPPDNTGAWIRKAARNRFIDSARSSKGHQAAHDVLARTLDEGMAPQAGTEFSVLDDELALIFLCCHPAISPTDQVILTLRLVGGLKPSEIGAAFRSDKEAVRSRLLRAKRKMRAAKLPTTLPPIADLPQRFGQVLATIYLIYNEGYLSNSDKGSERIDLIHEAIRLISKFCRLVPNLAEAHGLMALILLSEARRPARLAEGMLIPLDVQDRDLWDQDLLAAGLDHLRRAREENTIRRQQAGIYQSQAEIAAVHCQSNDFVSTDWKAIVEWYDRMLALQPSPAGQINRMAAASFVQSADLSIAQLGRWVAMEGESSESAALRADILRRFNRTKLAKEAYHLACRLEERPLVKAFLQKRLQEIANGT
jgi:RNA polymerase sigma-70 factor (ECF subfamily)